MAAFVELLTRHGQAITEQEARRPMGLHKRDHIRAILSDASPTLVDALYEEFLPLQTELLKDHCELIPGVLDTVERLRERGIPFACTTGFVSAMLRESIPAITRAGFAPEIFVTPDMVGDQGRPAPWMMFHAARHLGVYPMSRIVKVGDTPLDVDEGRNAGTWTVSVVESGNEVGLSRAQLASLSPRERRAAIASARIRLEAARPHYLIASVADLPPILDDIERRIEQGEKP